MVGAVAWHEKEWSCSWETGGRHSAGRDGHSWVHTHTFSGPHLYLDLDVPGPSGCITVGTTSFVPGMDLPLTNVVCPGT